MTPDEGEDKGHTVLIKDLSDLLSEAIKLEFHDFLNEKHTFPKMELHNRLMAIDKKLQVGKYDN